LRLTDQVVKWFFLAFQELVRARVEISSDVTDPTFALLVASTSESLRREIDCGLFVFVRLS
jgi:hypothetical protein